MPGISRLQQDTAVGLLNTNPVSTKVFVNNKEIAVLAATVNSHDPCPDPATHCSATMVEASPDVFAGGRRVVRAGDEASCTHTTTGSSDTFAN